VFVLFIILSYFFYLDHVNKESFSSTKRLEHVFSTNQDKNEEKNEEPPSTKFTEEDSTYIVQRLKNNLDKNQNLSKKNKKTKSVQNNNEGYNNDDKTKTLKNDNDGDNEKVKPDYSKTQSKNNKDYKNETTEQIGQKQEQEQDDIDAEYILQDQNNYNIVVDEKGNHNIVVDQENNDDIIVDEESNELNQCTMAQRFKRACQDKWRGYVESKSWNKLDKVANTLNDDVLPSIKRISQTTIETSNSTDVDNERKGEGQGQEKDPEEAMIIDIYYAQENKDIYVKLGLLNENIRVSKDNKEMDLENVNLERLSEINSDVEKMNRVMFSMEKYAPKFYELLLKKYKRPVQ